MVWIIHETLILLNKFLKKSILILPSSSNQTISVGAEKDIRHKTDSCYARPPLVSLICQKGKSLEEIINTKSFMGEGNFHTHKEKRGLGYIAELIKMCS